jgi:hypothetical protein
LQGKISSFDVLCWLETAQRGRRDLHFCSRRITFLSVFSECVLIQVLQHIMRGLQLHQALVDAGMPAAAAARASLQNLCQRLGVSSTSSSGGLKQQFFALLTHLLKEAPSLASSWVTDYLACSALLSSSDPEEAFVLQPQAVLEWCQEAGTKLEARVGAFLRAGPSAGSDAVLDLEQAAQSLLSIATAVQAVSSGNR